MKKILVMDSKNYDTSLPEIYRVAVRGVIFYEGKLLLIRSKYGEVKFPGGGQENGENDQETLIRETLEETGYHVIPNSIREFGEVVEKRLSTKEPMIWHQVNRYYFCDIDGKKDECQYTENELRRGFQQVWHTLEEAIAINEELLEKEGKPAYQQREYQVLKLLKEYMEN